VILFKTKKMERQDIDDEQEEHTVGSLDTSMDRYLENHGLWRKRIPQGLGKKKDFLFLLKVFWFII